MPTWEYPQQVFAGKCNYVTDPITTNYITIFANSDDAPLAAQPYRLKINPDYRYTSKCPLGQDTNTVK